MLGLEFGDDAGKSAIIVRALYDLKRANATSSAHHAQCMQKLGCKSFKADLDLWWKLEIRQ